jgi:hypothetical protein
MKGERTMKTQMLTGAELRTPEAIRPYLEALAQAEVHALQALEEQCRSAFLKGEGLANLSPFDTDLLGKHAHEMMIKKLSIK